MRKKETVPIKTVYYTDPLRDEFSTAVITPKTIDEAWDYTPEGIGWKVKRFLSYSVIARPLGYLFCKIALHSTFVNLQALSQADGKGCFIYGNHTQEIADAFLPNVALFPRSVYMIVHPDNVSMPVLGRITPYLGALPLPSNLQAMRHFKAALEKRISQGSCIMVFPEAHIWPYYTGIRPFPASSMKFPAELGVPSFTLTTTYHRRRFGAKPRTVSYLDGPFYPDESLSPRKRAQDLRERIYAQMVQRSLESDYEYIRYVPEKDGETP